MKPHKFTGNTRLHRSEYISFRTMRRRCFNKNTVNYPMYGGRGITVCARWKHFDQFFADMGPKPTPQHTLERKDVNGNYEPANCRWATMEEQRRNQRRSVYVEHDGKKVLLIDLIASLGLNGAVIRSRLNMGWPLADAIAAPIRPKKSSRKKAA